MLVLGGDEIQTHHIFNPIGCDKISNEMQVKGGTISIQLYLSLLNTNIMFKSLF